MSNITIRHAEFSDIDAIRAIFNSHAVCADTLQIPYPVLENWQERLGERQPGTMNLVAEREGEVIGHMGLEAYQKPRRKHVGTFGIAVAGQRQGQGVGSQLLQAAIDLADNWLNLSRLELEVYTDNQAAIALYQKYGFVIEGTAIDHAFRNGKLVNSHYMARIRHRAV